MSFQIGNVIYVFVIGDSEQAILPAIIKEEVRHKTLTGEKISYKVLIGSPDNPKAKTIDLDKLGNEGEIFGSLEEAQNILVQRATEHARKLCDDARLRSEQWYGNLDMGSSSSSQEGIDPIKLLHEVDGGTPGLVEIKNGVATPVQGNGR